MKESSKKIQKYLKLHCDHNVAHAFLVPGDLRVSKFSPYQIVWQGGN